MTPRPYKAQPWIPLDRIKWLNGSTRLELTHAERGIFSDFLCLAAETGGYIALNVDDGIPYTIQRLAKLLGGDEPLEETQQLIESTIEKCISFGKLKQLSTGVLQVVKWKDYQLNDNYVRQLRYRKRRGEENRGEDSSNVTVTPVTKTVTVFPKDSFEYKVALYLKKHRERRLPNGKEVEEPQLQKWAAVIEKMKRIDKHSESYIKQCTIALLTDSFYGEDIPPIGADKLRKFINEGNAQAVLDKQNKKKRQETAEQERQRERDKKEAAKSKKFIEESKKDEARIREEEIELAELKKKDKVAWAKKVCSNVNHKDRVALVTLREGKFTKAIPELIEALDILIAELPPEEEDAET